MMKKPWLMLIAVLVCSAGASWANAPGFLAVKALDGVEISIGSEAKGVTYNGQLVLMLDPGTYTVTAKKEGYGSSTHEVLVKSGEATALAIEMRESRVQTESLGAQESMVLGQKTGTIEVRSVPFSGASITINGTTYGNTDLRLRSFPVGPVRISAEYGGKTIQGVFQLKENETMMLQANFALAPSQIIEVFDVRLSIDSSDPAKRTLASVLPEGYYLELAGEYGSGTIKDIATPVRVMGPVHTIRYTDGVDYMDFEQRVDLKRGTDVRLQIPDLVLKGSSISLTHVEGGTFQMGSTGGDSDEKPVHSVTVGSFYMGTYEVTQDIYEQVMGSNPSNFKGARLPVENVTWHDAVAFANALSRRDGLQEVYTISGSTVSCDWSKKGYRLPTEAEWEYAARGGSKSQGYTNAAGSNTVGDVAWYDGNSGSKTQVAGTKKANELGLYDMSGNVWEWCWDWYGDYSASAQTNPRGPSSGSARVLRGGSWHNIATYVRPANRYDGTPSNRSHNFGFRLVLPAD